MIEENTFSAALAPAWVRRRCPFVTPGFCGDALVKPLPGDVDELREQPGPLRAAECGEELLPLDQGLGDRERDALGACVADVVEVYLGCGADHSLVLDPEGHRGLVEVHARVFVEVGVEGLVGQLYAVAVQLGEVDGQVPPFGQCPHFHRGAGVAWLGDLPVAGDERERHAVHLGVLGLEPASVWVDGVVAPPQAAADDLLAQQLAAERADTEDVGDGVGVPALGEHGDRDHAADVLAELALLADGVHRLAQQVGVGDLVHVGTRVAQTVGLLERLDLSRCCLPEVRSERLAGLELLRVDEDGALPGALHAPSSTLLSSGRLPGTRWLVPSGNSASRPAIQSKTSLETIVFGHTTISTGGGSPSAARRVCVAGVVLLVAAVQAAQRAFEHLGHHPALRPVPTSRGLSERRLGSGGWMLSHSRR